MKQRRWRIANRHNRTGQIWAPQFQRGGRAGVGHFLGHARHTFVTQGADHLILARQAFAGNPLADHIGVTQDWCAVFQRCPGGDGHVGGKLHMLFQPDHARGMDHAHGHDFFFGGKAGQIRFGTDGGKGLAVNFRAVGDVGMGHQIALRMECGEWPVCAGSSEARPL